MVIRSAKILISYKHKQKPHHRSMAVNPVVWLLLWHYFGQKFWFNLTKYVYKTAFEEFISVRDNINYIII